MPRPIAVLVALVIGAFATPARAQMPSSAPQVSPVSPDAAAARSLQTQLARDDAVVAFAVTRLLVPVMEVRLEYPIDEHLAIAAVAAYGGDLNTSTFAEIGVLGAGLRATWIGLGDRRIGVGMAIDARWEHHMGIGPPRNDGPTPFGAAAPELIANDVPGGGGNQQPTFVGASKHVLAGGGAVVARYSRRLLFAEFTGGIGYQASVSDLRQDDRHARIRRDSVWVHWAIWIGVWL